jgi:CDP-6-deoxy-D-xylo-4-hexulose-3-dehydrase
MDGRLSQKAGRLRREIRALVADYYGAAFADRPFRPGEDPVPVAGKVFDQDELANLVDAALDFHLTADRCAREFEAALATRVGVSHAILTNSGSSANLLALSALTSPHLGDRRLVPGDEVLTVASGFPTTVNPILQNGMIPVLLDVRLGTYNVDPTQLEVAVSGRTRAIILAHTLGNPFDVDEVQEVARRHDLALIEDTCDALGALYHGRPVGSFGDMATLSFYPAHHLTTGEGGAVLTSSPALRRIVRSLRDWGRDCWCEPGVDNTCQRRFDWKLGDLPAGYDHKYVYSHIGYNLKMTDLQAAVGLAQIAKLPRFIERRKRNFCLLYDGLRSYQEDLLLPESTPGADPSWFGFPITVRAGARFTRRDLILHLESRRVATRLLFGGNLTRQPAYRDAPFRIGGPLANTDTVMNQTFWIGVYPGLTDDMIAYVLSVFRGFFEG